MCIVGKTFSSYGLNLLELRDKYFSIERCPMATFTQGIHEFFLESFLFSLEQLSN